MNVETPTKTGLRTRKCYAAALGDCDGRGVTREHYISKTLLMRLGSFKVNGLRWTNGWEAIGKSAMTAHVLCGRHNEALWPLDSEIVRLYDALNAVRADGDLGTTVIKGEYLERWSLKVLAGLISSGNVRCKDGVRATSEIPADYLTVLFGESPMPEGWGFHAFVSPRPARANNVEVIVNSYPPGDVQEGLIYGVTTMILGLYFITIMRKLEVTRVDENEPDMIWHRPRGIDLDGRGQIDLRWDRARSNASVSLRRVKGSI